jgi:hypothetical protein
MAGAFLVGCPLPSQPDDEEPGVAGHRHDDVLVGGKSLNLLLSGLQAAVKFLF